MYPLQFYTVYIWISLQNNSRHTSSNKATTVHGRLYSSKGNKMRLFLGWLLCSRKMKWTFVIASWDEMAQSPQTTVVSTERNGRGQTWFHNATYNFWLPYIWRLNIWHQIILDETFKLKSWKSCQITVTWKVTSRGKNGEVLFLGEFLLMLFLNSND